MTITTVFTVWKLTKCNTVIPLVPTCTYQFPLEIGCCTYSKCISIYNFASSNIRALHTLNRLCSLFQLLRLWLPMQKGSSDMVQL